MRAKTLHNPNWATSAGGHPIELYHSDHSSAQQRPMLFMGGTHGDEPEGVWLAEAALEWIQEFNQSHPWYLIPCLNPDGYQKNNRVNSRGVDLNRNFPEKNWTSYHTAPRYFPGTEPASEPEVKALVQLIDQINPRVIIHFHSWKPCIVLTGDKDIELAQTLSLHTGYPFMQDIGYPTPGSLGEYGWREKGIPVICVEIEEKAERSKIEDLFRPAFENLFSV